MSHRSFQVVEGDLERVFERAEEHESKGQEIEGQIRELESKVEIRKMNILLLYHFRYTTCLILTFFR